VGKARYKEWTTLEGQAKLREYVKRGMNDYAIAREIGVDRSRLENWKRTHPEIAAVLTRRSEQRRQENIAGPTRKLNDVEKAQIKIGQWIEGRRAALSRSQRPA